MSKSQVKVEGEGCARSVRLHLNVEVAASQPESDSTSVLLWVAGMWSSG